jgi:serine carboxypeptidase-like clade 2
MNGGPGCSSKLGFIQEIGSYFLDLNKPYNLGDNLTKNDYGWNKLSNILYIDNPAGVGFSVNKDASYVYNDTNTAQDTYDALVNFFTVKYPEYINRSFYIAG